MESIWPPLELKTQFEARFTGPIMSGETFTSWRSTLIYCFVCKSHELMSVELGFSTAEWAAALL